MAYLCVWEANSSRVHEQFDLERHPVKTEGTVVLLIVSRKTVRFGWRCPPGWIGGENPEARILVWASGFASDTRHVAICWVDKTPANQTDSMESFYKSPKPRHPVYKHIDGHW